MIQRKTLTTNPVTKPTTIPAQIYLRNGAENGLARTFLAGDSALVSYPIETPFLEK